MKKILQRLTEKHIHWINKNYLNLIQEVDINGDIYLRC